MLLNYFIKFMNFTKTVFPSIELIKYLTTFLFYVVERISSKIIFL